MSHQEDLSLTKSDKKKENKFLGFWTKSPKKVPPVAVSLDKLPQSNSEPSQTESKIEINTLIESKIRRFTCNINDLKRFS